MACVKGSFVSLLGKVLISKLHLLALFSLDENAVWSSSLKKNQKITFEFI